MLSHSGHRIESKVHTFSTEIVLFWMRLPGAPKITMPPSVASEMTLFRTMLLEQLRLIPSAHSWNVSMPHGPISLF